jgi:hypothetical protein
MSVQVMRQVVELLASVQSQEAPEALADIFCEFDDDQQARFFVRVAAVMHGWGGGKLDMQAYYIGEHLKSCECSSPEARYLVRVIADAAEAP